MWVNKLITQIYLISVVISVSTVSIQGLVLNLSTFMAATEMCPLHQASKKRQKLESNAKSDSEAYLLFDEVFPDLN